jgi:hypothetical protein
MSDSSTRDASAYIEMVTLEGLVVVSPPAE